jgi:hypothetical protein
MAEEWRDIDGYDGLYQVSSLGSVKSNKFGRETVMKPWKNQRGYFNISLSKAGEIEHYLVSRLVAISFLPNPENKSDVDHIDRVPTNNRVANLRWATRRENMGNTCIVNCTGYRGVYRMPSGKFRARINIDDTLVHIGTFDTAEEASGAFEAVWAGLNP